MKHKLSFKWHIFGYFILFAGILLSILWVLQTVYLDSFYKSIKKSEVRKAMSATEAALESDELTRETAGLMEQYDLIITVTDSLGHILNGSEDSPAAISPQEFVYYYRAVQGRGGSAEIDIIGDVRDDENPFLPYLNEKSDLLWSDQRLEEDPAAADMDELIRVQMEYYAKYGQSVVAVKESTAFGEPRLVIVKSMISPLDTTVRTLKRQLLYISGIMLLLALGMAFVISRHVTRPIVQMNDTARRLGQGHYDVEFQDGAFKELSQLTETMNVTAGELARTETLRQELISNVSHDLRTPLTMMEAYAELMRDIPGENTPENAQVIIDEAGYLTRLVNDLLDISKLQAGVVELSRETYNLTEYLEEALGRKRRLLGEENYHITFAPKQQVWVKADPGRIGQVFENFLNNAAQYAGEGRQIRVRQIVKKSNVRIEVEDDGCGIDPKDMPYIWERYYRTNKNHRREVAGTGLGLSIVKRIMDLHGSACGAESILGQGSIFWFELPVVRSEEDGTKGNPGGCSPE